MKAWAYTARGTPSQVLKLRHDLPQPQPTDLLPGQVLIKISHVALFAPTVKLMTLLPHFNSNPWFPEHEFSGIIIASSNSNITGQAVGTTISSRFRPDDAVFGMLDPRAARDFNGVLAEYVILPEATVVRRPLNAKPEEAAGLGGSGCTAIQFLELCKLLKIERDVNGDDEKIVSTGNGKRVLITAGSSGTGVIMVQLAKVLVGKEGRVVATCSEKNSRLVRELGADEIVDYTKHPKLHEHLARQYSGSPFDVVIDIAGSDSLLYSHCPAYLKKDGTFAFAGNMPVTSSNSERNPLAGLIFVYLAVSWLVWIAINSIWPVALGGVPRRGLFHSGKIDTRTMRLVEHLVQEGEVKGVVDSVWKMDDALKAYERVLSGRARGKVVVSVQE